MNFKTIRLVVIAGERKSRYYCTLINHKTIKLKFRWTQSYYYEDYQILCTLISCRLPSKRATWGSWVIMSNFLSPTILAIYCATKTLKITTVSTKTSKNCSFKLRHWNIHDDLSQQSVGITGSRNTGSIFSSPFFFAEIWADQMCVTWAVDHWKPNKSRMYLAQCLGCSTAVFPILFRVS